MKIIDGSNHVHEKKSSFTEKTQQAFGILCSGDNGKSCCRDYWCPTQHSHSFLHEVEISHSLLQSISSCLEPKIKINWLNDKLHREPSADLES